MKLSQLGIVLVQNVDDGQLSCTTSDLEVQIMGCVDGR